MSAKPNPYVLATPGDPNRARGLQEILQRRKLGQVVGEAALIAQSMARHFNRALDVAEERAGETRTFKPLIDALLTIEMKALRDAADTIEARLLAGQPEEMKRLAGERALMGKLARDASRGLGSRAT